jgi:hypothetical protein
LKLFLFKIIVISKGLLFDSLNLKTTINSRGGFSQPRVIGSTYSRFNATTDENGQVVFSFAGRGLPSPGGLIQHPVLEYCQK